MKRFELDKKAHAQGRCSFSTTALCSANGNLIIAEDLLKKLDKMKYRHECIKGGCFGGNSKGEEIGYYQAISEFRDILNNLIIK